jgi:hypothetical protein
MIQLTDEQNALYEECVSYERGDKHFSDCKITMGILGSGHGTGKTYVMIALMLEKHVEFMNIKYMSLGCNKVLLSMHDTLIDICMDVVVIPYHLLRKWDNACEGMMGGKGRYRVISLSRHIIEAIECFEKIDVLLIVNTIYNEFCRYVKKKKMRMRRVIYDEADSLKSITEDLPSRFTWYVTGTYENLLYPYGKVIWDSDIELVISKFTGILHKGYVKKTFLSLVDNNMTSEFLDSLVVKQRNKNVKHNDIRFVECVSFKTEFMDTKFGTTMKDREIHSYVMRDMIDSAISLIDYRMKSGIEEMMQYNYGDRIVSCEDCLICHDQIQYKTVLKCCGNSYCFRCIFRWLSVNGNNDSRCPMCNENVIRSNMVIIVDGYELDNVRNENKRRIFFEGLIDKLFEERRDFFGKNGNKIDNIIKLIKWLFEEGDNKRIIVHYPVEYIYMNISKKLMDEGIDYCVMRGNGNKVLYTLNQFEKGNPKVLLIGPTTYRCGVDIHNVTDVIMIQYFDNDIERKILGRVRGECRCWYLLHRSEAMSYVKRCDTNVFVEA